MRLRPPATTRGLTKTLILTRGKDFLINNDTSKAGETCNHTIPKLETLGEEWGTVSSLAARYGCHQNTIRNWIHTGKLTATRFGPRMIRIRETDLQLLLKPYENGQSGQWSRQGL